MTDEEINDDSSFSTGSNLRQRRGGGRNGGDGGGGITATTIDHDEKKKTLTTTRIPTTTRTAGDDDVDEDNDESPSPTPSSGYKVLGIGSDYSLENGIVMTKLGCNSSSSSNNSNEKEKDAQKDTVAVAVYGAAFQMTRLVESILIVDTELGYDCTYYPQGGRGGMRRYYPQGGSGSSSSSSSQQQRRRHVTKVLCVKSYRGFQTVWEIGGDDVGTRIPIGTTIHVYFLPDERLFLWEDIGNHTKSTIDTTTSVEDVLMLLTQKYRYNYRQEQQHQRTETGTRDSQRRRRRRKQQRRRSSIIVSSLLSHDVWATTQFAIDPDDQLSNMIVMSTDRTARYIMGVFYFLPHLIMIVLSVWVVKTAPKHMMVRLYHHESIMEWLCVISIYCSIFMKNGYDIGNDVFTVREYYQLATKVSNTTQRRSMKIAAGFGFLNILQIPFSFLLSMFIATYLSEDLFLNVLLNVVALEFVTDIDDAMVTSFIRRRYSHNAEICFSILDIQHAEGFNADRDLWHKSCSSSARVLQLLSDGEDLTNDMRWKLLTSTECGLGLLGRTEQQEELNDTRDCVTKIRLHVGIIDWKSLTENDIINYGSLYLKGTTHETWEHFIGYRMRALLFQYYPEQTINFPWYGLNFDGFDLQDRHAPHIADICNVHGNNVEMLSIGSITDMHLNIKQHATIGNNTSDGPNNFIMLLCEGLKENNTLQVVSFDHTNLNDDCAVIIASFLRNNTSVKQIWLTSNPNITDTGVYALLRALTPLPSKPPQQQQKKYRYNKTIMQLIFGANTISPGCEEKCIKEGNNRMVFLSEKYPDVDSFITRSVKFEG